jgi:hypothetical protein
MTTYQEIMQEFKQEIAQGIELEDIKDRAYEYVDNYVPVYNNRIIEEWQNMPGEYDDRGAAELGVSEDTSIVRLMSLDLYLYYQDLVSSVLNDIAEELESVE